MNVEAYNQLRRALDELVGRINGRFSTVNWSPVQYLFQSIVHHELLPLYRAADVMLVTPTRDGMNLVAKEFVACRGDDDGVLILSEFTGAAWELGEALIVNPYDVDEIATAIQTAITLPRRHALAYAAAAEPCPTLDRAPLGRVLWPRVFPNHGETISGCVKRQPAAAKLARILEAPHVVLILDYDGTLVPYAPMPDLAAPDAELIDLLKNSTPGPRRKSTWPAEGTEPVGRWFGNARR